MFLEHFLLADVNETNVYLIGCAKTGDAALIDAGGFDPAVVDAVRARGAHVRSVLITHDHYDHTGGLDAYLEAFDGCEVIAGGDRAGGRPARAVGQGEQLRVGELRVEVLDVSGHTGDSVAYLFTREPDGEPDSPRVPLSIVFSGDALFAGSVGGAAGAAHDREIANIRKHLLTLPPDTPVYPGHGPGTTVGVEKDHNPFLQS